MHVDLVGIYNSVLINIDCLLLNLIMNKLYFLLFSIILFYILPGI